MFKKVLKYGGIGCGGFIALTLILGVILAIAGGGEDQTQTPSPDSQAATSNTPDGETSSANPPQLAVTPGAMPTTDECPTTAEELYLIRTSDTMGAVLTDLELLSSLSIQAASNSMMFGNPEWLGRVRSMTNRMEANAKQLRRFGSDPESVRDIHSDMERMADLLEEAAERFGDGVNFASAQDADEAADAFGDVADSVKDIMELADSAGNKFQDFCR